MISVNLHWSIGQALLDVALGYLVFVVFVFVWKLCRVWCWRRERARGDREALILLRKEASERRERAYKREEGKASRKRRRSF